MAEYTLEDWLRDLTSGEFEQCQRFLHREGDGFCCLGVWVQGQGPKANNLVWEPAPSGYSCFSEFAGSQTSIDNDGAIHEFAVMCGIDVNRWEWDKVANRVLAKLMNMNDGTGGSRNDPKTFKEIAQWAKRSMPSYIKDQWKHVESESRAR